MNPARQLAKVFEKWSAEGGIPTVRLAGNEDTNRSREYIDEIYTAARSLREIALILEYQESKGRDMGYYKKSLHRWCLHLATAQTKSTRQPFIESDFLRMYGENIDHWFGVLPVASTAIQEEKSTAESMLKELIQKLLDDDSLDETLRNHTVTMCKRLLDDIQKYAEQGFYDFGEAISLLKIYVSAAAERSSNKSMKDWFRWFNDNFLKNPTFAALAPSAAAYLGANQGAIGS